MSTLILLANWQQFHGGAGLHNPAPASSALLNALPNRGFLIILYCHFLDFCDSPCTGIDACNYRDHRRRDNQRRQHDNRRRHCVSRVAYAESDKCQDNFNDSEQLSELNFFLNFSVHTVLLCLTFLEAGNDLWAYIKNSTTKPLLAVLVSIDYGGHVHLCRNYFFNLQIFYYQIRLMSTCCAKMFGSMAL